jgi:hypothetical protein
MSKPSPARPAPPPPPTGTPLRLTGRFDVHRCRRRQRQPRPDRRAIQQLPVGFGASAYDTVTSAVFTGYHDVTGAVSSGYQDLTSAVASGCHQLRPQPHLDGMPDRGRQARPDRLRLLRWPRQPRPGSRAGRRRPPRRRRPLAGSRRGRQPPGMVRSHIQPTVHGQVVEVGVSFDHDGGDCIGLGLTRRGVGGQNLVTGPELADRDGGARGKQDFGTCGE